MNPKVVDIKADEPPPGERPDGRSWFAAADGGQALLTAVFDALPIAIYATDAAGRIIFFNASAAALLGEETHIGSSGWSGWHPLFWPDGSSMDSDKSPMGIALKEGRAIRGAEAVLKRSGRPDVRLLIYATPLFDGETLKGAVNTLVELGEHDRTNYLEQRLAAIVECSEDAIISKDLNGTIVTWNDAAGRLFGYTAAEAIGRPVMMLIPEERHPEEEAILSSIRNGRPVARYETYRKRKDGSLVPIALTVSPLRDSSGRIIGASKIARDITDQMKIREHQTLVLNEMSHRVKNVLAVAGGLVGLSARSAQSPTAMAQAVQARLGAYSRAHELTRTTGAAAAQGATRETTLQTLIHAIVSPYLNESEGEANFSIEGEDVVIDANATASLALVLHEFTTNAAKYGALSTTAGKITATSRIVNGGFELVWTERGGPKITGVPARQGFGSVLATKTVEGQLNGTISYAWERDGVVITMFVPQDDHSPA